jgi:hypothetical protein
LPAEFGGHVANIQILKLPYSLPEYLWRGQLPALVSFPNEAVPAYFSAYVQTYVERDIRMMANISDLALFGRFLRLCGALTGREIFQSQLGRELGINPKTAGNWLNLLVHSYQGLALPAYSGKAIKRLSSKPKGHLQDSGLACFLNSIPSPQSLLSSPLLGGIFESWGVGATLRQTQRLPLAPVPYHWRTARSAEVDLVLDYDGKLFPIEFKASARLSGHDTRGIQAFRSTYPQAVPGIVIYGGEDAYKISEHAFLCRSLESRLTNPHHPKQPRMNSKRTKKIHHRGAEDAENNFFMFITQDQEKIGIGIGIGIKRGVFQKSFCAGKEVEGQ